MPELEHHPQLSFYETPSDERVHEAEGTAILYFIAQYSSARAVFEKLM